VIEDLEMRIVNPHRPGEVQRDGARALPVSRHLRQLGQDQPDEVSVGGWIALEHGYRGDLQRCVLVLGEEESRIQPAHPLHGRHRSAIGSRL